MTVRDSQRVSYVGPERSGLALGDRGIVLSASGDAAHVQWVTGARTDQVDFVPADDLVAMGRPPKDPPGHTTAAAFADSLTYGTMVTVAVRETFDESGEVGLLNALASEGHLANLSSVAEEALALVASRVREDDAMRQVLGQLDAEEGEALINLTAAVVLRDAFGGGDA